MIIGMIKAHPIKNRMAREASSPGQTQDWRSRGRPQLGRCLPTVGPRREVLGRGLRYVGAMDSPTAPVSRAAAGATAGGGVGRGGESVRLAGRTVSTSQPPYGGARWKHVEPLKQLRVWSECLALSRRW
jgi:hypothetical protein